MRCTDPEVGVKVLSYDLLDDAERATVDAHLSQCKVCADLKEQTFGNEGAFRELEYRAFKLSQRQRVGAHDWWLRRLRDLALPLAVLIIALAAFLAYLSRRVPDVPTVGIVHLATLKDAELGGGGMLAPRIERHSSSMVLAVDRRARVLAFEVSREQMRRLLPAADAEPITLRAFETRELPLPARLDAQARVLLVLVPIEPPTTAAEWDVAVQAYVSGSLRKGDASRGAWPQGLIPTLRWID